MNVISMNVKSTPTVHLTRLVLLKNVSIHVNESLVEGEQNAKLNNIEQFVSVHEDYKETQ